MLRSNSKSLGNHVVSPEEEKERLRWEGFAEKRGFRAAVSVLVGPCFSKLHWCKCAYCCAYHGANKMTMMMINFRPREGLNPLTTTRAISSETPVSFHSFIQPAFVRWRQCIDTTSMSRASDIIRWDMKRMHHAIYRACFYTIALYYELIRLKRYVHRKACNIQTRFPRNCSSLVWVEFNAPLDTV